MKKESSVAVAVPHTMRQEDADPVQVKRAMRVGDPSSRYPNRCCFRAQAVRRLLDGALRVGLIDGRIIIGQFSCLDKQRNILLTDSRETRVGSDSERFLGTVLVPRKYVASCHAAQAA